MPSPAAVSEEVSINPYSTDGFTARRTKISYKSRSKEAKE